MAQQDGNRKRAEVAREIWNARRLEILWLYENQEWPQAKIAEYFGVSLAAIQKIFKRLNIRPRPRANIGKRNGRYKDGSQSTLYRTMIEKDKCSRCGNAEHLVIHHRNGNHQDNHLENLQVLCEKCHNSTTKRLWWRLRKESQL